ncbi:hypothetical protein CGZ80_11115 [Rhodopirellula sp. MGV]|nr:hypothetical protein CGZ80_11115 [Rhodopirellula sp. MGV]PNY35653.1 hypothetical protein C2E31_17100 [Rhodopirellula baltica]
MPIEKTCRQRRAASCRRGDAATHLMNGSCGATFACGQLIWPHPRYQYRSPANWYIAQSHLERISIPYC